MQVARPPAHAPEPALPGARPPTADGHDVCERLIHLFRTRAVPYRTIPHPPEGRTEAASRLRGHPLEQAAKSLVVRVATGKRSRRYVLAVVPGDRRVDLPAVAARYGARGAAFATRGVAERLGGSVSGSIVPFAFAAELDLLVDAGLPSQPEIFFNAGRLDLSVALAVPDYLALAAPAVAPIAR
ncbi:MULTISPECIES: YbaK/EbsC family protein [Streptomyces]|uniref:YbaK/EbsC family protein n=1 Tax=Streptomyces TaxID=1883 RepID=UPI002248C39B|nr:YbaK/EbsC family protein [Streptomyces sp. JHD 1]MCX2968579.1 YbaK/prolyl-tRNA synthetase associated domain-containing protein [Streptomyces sp. JHD 1]